MKKLTESQLGILYALGAYFLWGIAPLYFKYLDFISVNEILSHRVIWSFVITALFVSYLKDWPNFLSVCCHYKSLLMLVMTSLLISINWLVFIWAINNEKMLEASLGYFINPIVNVVLGVIFLNERLSRLKWFAVLLAFIGISTQAWQLGELPWVSLVLAITFAFYGLLRKKVKVKAITGLFFETTLILPVALLYLLMFDHSDTANLLNNSWSVNMLLISAGLVTALPLICFGQAALRLPLSTLGFFQYLAPSMVFLFAVFVYDEPISLIKIFTFVCIWSGILVFIFEHKITKLLK